MSIKKNGNNAGLSLIEMLVALAVSSLVILACMTLLVNGLTSYRRQTITSQLQENADLALTHISDAIFEAEVVDIEVSESANKNTTKFYVAKDKSYGYVYDSATKTLSVESKSGTETITSVLCNKVEKFKVQIFQNSFELKEVDKVVSLVGVKDVVNVKVTIGLEDGGVVREGARVTGIRNDMDMSKVIIFGFEPDEYPDKKTLIDEGVLLVE